MNALATCGLDSMSTCNSSALSTVLLSGSRLCGNMSKAGNSHGMKGSGMCYGYRTQAHCGRAYAKLSNQESWGNNMLYKFLWSNENKGSQWSKPYSSVETGRVGNETFCVEPCCAQASFSAVDVSDGEPREEQLENLAVARDLGLGDRTLKLVCGSCCLPHPSKVATGGEDAHFICADEQAIGVADGVGGWALHGIDAGEYARELMSNAVSAIKEEPKGLIDPVRVLEKAHARTKKVGSSTACILTLTDQTRESNSPFLGIHAANLGDSGFVIVREGSTVFQSPPQQHDFNFPYQLDAGGAGDLPKDAQVYTVPVAPGDVIVVGTDGLFDNLYTYEVADVVMNGLRDNLGPQAAAEKIALLARQRALDKSWKSPFSAAAQEAGYYHIGGKLDDISVVVSYVTVNPSS